LAKPPGEVETAQNQSIEEFYDFLRVLRELRGEKNSYRLASFDKLTHLPRGMQKVKDTLRATVRLSFDGRVYKIFRGPKAEERFANEVRILRFLEKRGCPFVPRLLETDPARLQMVTTNCGTRVEHLDEERLRELFDELASYGVRHDDAETRNVTYRQSDGRFCLIDFEFATILPGFERPDDGTPS
jgi:hypothetical protein